MPREKLFDEEEVIRKAMELFWEKGYESTSLNDLTDHLGIGKGSFYATFESKENLFNKCIERYSKTNLPLLHKALESEQDIEIVLYNLLEDYVETMLSDPKRKGCFMANSCALVDGEHVHVEGKILEHYSHIKNLLVDFMERGGVNTVKAKSVAATIVTFLIGVSQQAKFDRDKSGYLSSIGNIIESLR